jgi:hypothetical protein
MTKAMISWLFCFAGVYDFVIGLVFLCAGEKLFAVAGLNPPNHWGYIQFCSLMLMVFGTMFFAIAKAPSSNRNLIPFGMLLKISYVSIVAYYWLTTGCPLLFKPFAVIDFAMLVLFAMAYRATANTYQAVSPASN